MTKDELDAIKKYVKKASPAPWTFDDSLSDYEGSYGGIKDSDNNMVCHFGGDAGYDPFAGDEFGEFDREFVIKARSDMIKLIEEIERLNAMKEYLYSIVTNAQDNLRVMKIVLEK